VKACRDLGNTDLLQLCGSRGGVWKMKEYALSPSSFFPLCFANYFVQLQELHNAELVDFCRSPGGFFDIYRHLVEGLDINITSK
jgi:hypothetical protein